MLSRIFWVGIAGIALVAGMILQDGDRMFGWTDHDVSAKTERAIEARIDRAVDRSVDRMQVVGSDGREFDVPPETKRALADAVGRLVKAEAEFAIVRVRDGSREERRAAGARRDQARAEVEVLKAAIKQQEQASKLARGDVSGEIDREVREEVRAAIRDAVRN